MRDTSSCKAIKSTIKIKIKRCTRTPRRSSEVNLYFTINPYAKAVFAMFLMMPSFIPGEAFSEYL